MRSIAMLAVVFCALFSTIAVAQETASSPVQKMMQQRRKAMESTRAAWTRQRAHVDAEKSRWRDHFTHAKSNAGRWRDRNVQATKTRASWLKQRASAKKQWTRRRVHL